MNKKNFLIFLSLTLIVSLIQLSLANKHFEFGFFTDDWLFLSAYRAYITNPILDLYSAWKAMGSHWFAHSYYIGILYNFFELNYPLYHITNQIIKIVATLTLYPLVLMISKNKLLAFLATIFFAIHYSPYGTLDNASRGEDFIAIASMNLFLLTYLYIIKRNLSTIFILLVLSIWFLITLFIDPTRLFPLLLVLPFIELISLIYHKNFNQILLSLKRLSFIYSPILLLVLMTPETIIFQLRYSIGLYEKLLNGNWQLLITPFSAFGSTYIPKESWFLFGQPAYNSFELYLSYLLFGPIFIFTIIYSLIGPFILKKPLRFIIRTIVINFVFGIIVFFPVNYWLSLSSDIKTPVDPGTFLTAIIIGLFIFGAGTSLLWQWKESKEESNLLPLVFISQLFSLIFIYSTWIFADINSIFNTVHAYLNIPAIGTSIVLAIILYIFYERLTSVKIFNRNKIIVAFLIVTILTLYLKLSSVSVDNYFSYWLHNGLRASDQSRIADQFWEEVGENKDYSIQNLPLIYIDSLGDLKNGSFYSETIIWRMAAWFDLKYKDNKDGRFPLCHLLVLDKEKLEKHVRVSNDRKSLIYDGCGADEIYKIENFYAFRLSDRNLIPNRLEILTKLGIAH